VLASPLSSLCGEEVYEEELLELDELLELEGEETAVAADLILGTYPAFFIT